MELFDFLQSPVETTLVRKAGQNRIPIGGTMELLPLCNMACKMCYIRQSKAEMEAEGRMLTCDEWLGIAEDAKKNGTLFLLLTGGEPLLYPEFERLYTSLTDMGFIITINTNGTLLNDRWIRLFAERPCRRLNITLYGPDDETYGQLCGNPQGFTQVMRGAAMLKERGIPFRFTYSAMPQNFDKMEAIFAAAREMEVSLSTCYYMFPPCRIPEGAEPFRRLTPEEAARGIVHGAQLKQQEENLYQAARFSLSQLEAPPKMKALSGKLTCRGGVSGFWMTWKGELMPCGMFPYPKTSLLDKPFAEAWKEIVRETEQIRLCPECQTCKKQNLCEVCGASCVTETGSFAGKPEYMCRMTDEKIKLMLRFLPEEEQLPFRQLLGE